ncbi:MAG: PEGA domain-containing protein [Myxococcota bacterium]
MRRWRTAAAALVVTCGVMVAASVATAQGEGKKRKFDPYTALTRANLLASKGSLTRSIPHYESVLEADPIGYTIAFYNLGEVLKAKGDCPKAVLRYQAYVYLGTDSATKRASKQGILDCKAAGWGSLKLDVTPSENLRVFVDGVLLATSVPSTPIRLAPGSYTLRIEVDEHEVVEDKVTIDREEIARSYAPEKLRLFGTAEISVNHDGATVSLTPKGLDKEDPSIKPIELSSPIAEPVKLATGKYFLEVSKPGYNRWIRNIYITSGSPTSVDVRLTAKLPSEIQ